MKYNNFYWEQLPSEGKEAAQKLGYSQESWDADVFPESIRKAWKDLDKIQRQGAQEMGYDESSWNSSFDKWKKAKYLTYVSHLCFVFGSVCYLKLSLASVQWDQYIGYHKVPKSVLEADADEVWEKWAHENNQEDMLRFRKYYWVESERFSVFGACSYAVMGLVEIFIGVLRNSLTIQTLLIPLGGLLAMSSALNVGGSLMKYSDAASITCYLLSCTKLDSFFVGSVIECIVACAYLAGFDGAWLLYLEVIASLMWLYCAVIGVAAEFNVSLTRYAISSLMWLYSALVGVAEFNVNLTRFFLEKKRLEKKILQTPCSPHSNGQEKDERHKE